MRSKKIRYSNVLTKPVCATFVFALFFGLVFNSTAIGNEFNSGPAQEPLVVSANFKMKPDSSEGSLIVEAVVATGRHLYSQNHGGPEIATSITVTESDQFELLGEFTPDTPPHRKMEDGKLKEDFEGTVTWYAPIKLSEGVDPESVVINVKFRGQTCDATSCLPPVTLKMESAYSGDFSPEAQAEAVAAVEAVKANEDAPIEKSAGEWEGMSLALVLPLAFLAGLILNIMPCVLPVIGLKVMSFVQQAGENPFRVFMLNVVFSLGMIAVFLVLATLAVFFGYGWGELYESLLFKVIMIGVVFVFGLSFFGVWEIPIPGFVGDASASKAAQKEGMVGAFLKGVLTTLLATPCSGPMLIPAVVWAIAQPPLITYLVFLAMGVGMAFPFLLIGAMPKLAKALPRPGNWMVTFKQLMGFVLMGTCVFFLGSVGNKYTVSVLSLMVFLGLSCWYIGRSEESSKFADKFKGWTYALVIGAAGVWFSFYFLLPQHELEFQPYTKVALQEHLDSGTTVFVDFTADW